MSIPTQWSPRVDIRQKLDDEGPEKRGDPPRLLCDHAGDDSQGAPRLAQQHAPQISGKHPGELANLHVPPQDPTPLTNQLSARKGRVNEYDGIRGVLHKVALLGRPDSNVRVFINDSRGYTFQGHAPHGHQFACGMRAKAAVV
jgi:hypothetical protein